MKATLPSASSRARRATLPATAKTEGTRGRVLAVALKLFAKQGFHGTSVRDLAAALELQPSALYAHFRSKEHVLAELILAGHEAHHQALSRAVDSAGADAVEQLRALVRANARFHAEHALLSVIVNEEMFALPPALAAPALAFRTQGVRVLFDVLELGVAKGRFSVTDLDVTAGAIGAMSMRVPYWFESHAEQDIVALADAQAELALRIVGAEGRRS